MPRIDPALTTCKASTPLSTHCPISLALESVFYSDAMKWKQIRKLSARKLDHGPSPCNGNTALSRDKEQMGSVHPEGQEPRLCPWFCASNRSWDKDGNEDRKWNSEFYKPHPECKISDIAESGMQRLSSGSFYNSDCQTIMVA